MFGAAVPEAPIDEDRDLPTGECYVRDATRLSQDLVVDPVAQTDAMHLFPQRHFRICSLLPHVRHAATGIG